MGKHAKTLRLIEAAREVLQADHPMTVRQVYYQLVSRQVIENNRGQYQAVSNALVSARQEGVIAWEWIEDRLRRPRKVSMWEDLQDFGATVISAYRRDVWAGRPKIARARTLGERGVGCACVGAKLAFRWERGGFFRVSPPP